MSEIVSGSQMRCHLRILNGIHADASCELRDAPLVIGSDRDVDIALLDEGLAGRHVSFQRTDAGTLQIAALADGVTVDGVALAQSQARELSRPARVTIAGVAFELVYEQQAAPEARKPARKASGNRLSVPRVVGAVGVLLAVLAVRIVVWPMHIAQAVVRPLPPRLAMAVPDASPPQLSDEGLGNAVVDALRKSGVSGLNVEARAGVVGVSGDVSSEQWTGLEKVEQWFDRSYGQRYVLISSVKKIDKVPLILPIQSVWDGSDPSIVVRGQRYTLGSDVMSGYRLASISGGSIVLLHEGGRIVVPY